MNVLGIVERPQSFAVFRGQAPMPGIDASNDLGHRFEASLIDANVVACDRLDCAPYMENSQRLVGAIAQQELQCVREGINRDQIG
jgi:hypothetical protein